MEKKIISEGKTTNEAIEKGLRELKLRKEDVEITVLEEENKRSFFSILAPRTVKVEIAVKENDRKLNSNELFEKNKLDIDNETFEKMKENIEEFFKEFLEKSNIKDKEVEITNKKHFINVSIVSSDMNHLIGYRGEVLNSLQVIINGVANKGMESRNKVIIDINGYRDKREKVLEELADKISKTVIKNKKSITLEPMTAFERKIIHSRLQNSNSVKTYSIGEEPYRKIVISLK